VVRLRLVEYFMIEAAEVVGLSARLRAWPNSCVAVPLAMRSTATPLLAEAFEMAVRLT